MTCESFKSNGFEEGGEEDNVVVVVLLLFIAVGMSLLIVEFLGNVEELLDSTNDDVANDPVEDGKVNVEFFNCDFKLDEDEEDFSIDGGFAGTKKLIKFNKILLIFNLKKLTTRWSKRHGNLMTFNGRWHRWFSNRFFLISRWNWNGSPRFWRDVY